MFTPCLLTMLLCCCVLMLLFPSLHNNKNYYCSLGKNIFAESPCTWSNVWALCKRTEGKTQALLLRSTLGSSAPLQGQLWWAACYSRPRSRACKAKICMLVLFIFPQMETYHIDSPKWDTHTHTRFRYIDTDVSVLCIFKVHAFDLVGRIFVRFLVPGIDSRLYACKAGVCAGAESSAPWVGCLKCSFMYWDGFWFVKQMFDPFLFSPFFSLTVRLIVLALTVLWSVDYSW